MCDSWENLVLCGLVMLVVCYVSGLSVCYVSGLSVMSLVCLSVMSVVYLLCWWSDSFWEKLCCYAAGKTPLARVDTAGKRPFLIASGMD